jgi:Avidin family
MRVRECCGFPLIYRKINISTNAGRPESPDTPRLVPVGLKYWHCGERRRAASALVRAGCGEELRFIVTSRLIEDTFYSRNYYKCHQRGIRREKTTAGVWLFARLLRSWNCGPVDRSIALADQRGSELRITSVGKNGSLHGTFTNYASGFQCQGIPYPITGMTSPGPTTFTVNFVQCRTVTRWDGTASVFGMPTQWVLRHGGQTETGTDFFFRKN